MPPSYALNGCGRIGRLLLRRAVEAGLPPVAINDRFGAGVLAQGLRRDSVHGAWCREVRATSEDRLLLDGHEVPVLRREAPEDCPWEALEVDVLVEATGRFLGREQAEGHLEAGARRVLVTAPLEEVGSADFLWVPGIGRDAEIEDIGEDLRILSLASCTTQCAAPPLFRLHGAYGVAGVHLTTVHASTNDQVLLDAGHDDPRRARAAGLNIIPTTTRAEDALRELLPWLGDRIAAASYRVPVAGGSLVELVCRLERPPARAEEIVQVLRDAADGRAMSVIDEPLVSSDIIGREESSLVDAHLTRLLPDGHLKLVAWYDNETAYAARVLEVLQRL